MAKLLKTEVHGGLTVVGNIDIFLNKKDFSEPQTVYLMDNETGLINDSEVYKLQYTESMDEDRDTVKGENWKLWKDLDLDKNPCDKANVTIQYNLSNYVYGIYTLQNGDTVETWKGSLQGGGGAASPESVIFTEDLTLTERFGRYYDSGNSYTIESKNKSLSWLIKDAFINESIGTEAYFTISTNFTYSPAMPSDGYVERGTHVQIGWTQPTKSLVDYQYGSDLEDKISYSSITNGSSATTVSKLKGATYDKTDDEFYYHNEFSQTISITGTAEEVEVTTNTGSTKIIENFSKTASITSKKYKTFQYIFYKAFNNDTDASSISYDTDSINNPYDKLNSTVKSTTDYPSTFSITFEAGRKDFVLLIPNELNIRSVTCLSETNVPYDMKKKEGTAIYTKKYNKADTGVEMEYDIFYYHKAKQLGQEGSTTFNFTLEK